MKQPVPGKDYYVDPEHYHCVRYRVTRTVGESDRVTLADAAASPTNQIGTSVGIVICGGKVL